MKECIAVAFSGGLDTSWLVARYAQAGHTVIAITVDTGGWSAAGRLALSHHANVLGAAEHVLIDGRDALYDDHIAWLIRGNVLRGGVYPLCVGVERVVQARLFAEAARERNLKTLVHGSTSAGNDQVRFDVILRAVAPNASVLAPIRDENVSREMSLSWLTERGLGPMQSDGAISINRGLWGTTAGGSETHDSWCAPHETSYTTTAAPKAAPPEGEMITVSFKAGLPVGLNDKALHGWAIVEALGELGALHGVGRGVHLGDTILGIKGRIAFEAPAAAILIPAHRELEKLTMTAGQRFWKDHMANVYGGLVHEAKSLDPLARDIEALIESSQIRVDGDVRLFLRQGSVSVQGVRSPFSLMDVQKTTYGEHTELWTPEDARGFTRIHGTPQWLCSQAGLAP